MTGAIVVLLDDNEQGAIDARSMPFLHSDPHGSWLHLPHAVTSTPLCTPARHTIYRGQRCDHHGQIENALVPPLAFADNVGAWLAGEGWTTGFLGKLANGWPFADFATHDPGWTTLFAVGDHAYTGWTAWRQTGAEVAGGAEYLTDRLALEAVAFLEDVAGDFLLMIAPGAPHGPPVPAARHAAVDAGGATNDDDPPGFNDQIANAPAHMVYDALTFQQREEIRGKRADCRRTLLAVDELLEDVFGVLVARGLLATTSVWVLNDNGASLGRHRLDVELAAGTASGKRRPYGWCVDAQLRVRWPGAVGRTVPGLVTTADLPVTFAAIGGAVPTVTTDGRDLRPLLDGTAVGWRSSIETCYLDDGHADIPPWWSIRWRTGNGTRDWRYTEYETDEVELFDLVADPRELTNVAAVPGNAARRTMLERRLARRRTLPDGRA